MTEVNGQEESMAEEVSARAVDLYPVVRIVGSYVRHHQIEPGQLIGVILEVDRALAGLRQIAPPAPVPRHPAVPIWQSVRRKYVVCLECRFRSRTLRRHLRVQHGLGVDEYRARWDLPSNHPVTAPGYSARRSTLAKQIGLGRKPGIVVVRPPATGRRRRQRSAPER
jgi:predicted transcriptional regulator